MSMDYGVQLTHYILLEDSSVVSDLYDIEEFEDVFFYCGDSHDNILLSNSGESMFHGGKHCDPEVVKIQMADVQKNYSDFVNSMDDIIVYLDEQGIKYKINFGVVSYYC